MKPMNLADFILLRAVFNSDLFTALVEKDEAAVTRIVETDPTFLSNVEEGFVEKGPIDIEQLHTNHQRELATDDYSWAL